MKSYPFIRPLLFLVFFIVLTNENVSASSLEDESCSPYAQLIIENKSEGKAPLIIEAVVCLLYTSDAADDP